MDMSVLYSNDPAGFAAEAAQKKLEQGIIDYLNYFVSFFKVEMDESSLEYKTPSSIAGADSGQFHLYRKIRRIESERSKKIEEILEKKQKDLEIEKKYIERVKKEQNKTAKNRFKRLKRKSRQSHSNK